MYIVTGVSRGLGKAIAEQLLEQGQHVVGVGRSHAINHANFEFIACDFSNADEVEQLHIPIEKGSVTLINNAGILGTVNRSGDLPSSDLQQVLQVNTIAPKQLWTKIYAQIVDKDAFSLVNISSGAANRAIPSWAAYCASKAALNMLSETFYLEEQERGNHPKVYAVAPGVVDTDMQTQIRAVDANNFSSVGNFIALKENNELYSAELAASRLVALLKKPYSGDVFYDLRTL